MNAFEDARCLRCGRGEACAEGGVGHCFQGARKGVGEGGGEGGCAGSRSKWFGGCGGR